MASQIQKGDILGNFKPPRSQRGHKQSKTIAERPGMSPAHLADIRRLPCCVCLITPGGEPHHVKTSGNRGMGLRGLDRDTVPMCNECHINGVERAGAKNELAWFKARGVDVLDLMVALWLARGDFAKQKRIVLEHKRSNTK